MLTINLIWGFNLVMVKLGTEELSPMLLLGLRFALLFAILFPLLRWVPGQMSRVLPITMLNGALHFGLMFWALSISTASVVAIATQLYVPFATVMSMVFLGERVGLWRAGGILFAFGGVMVIGFDPILADYVPGLAVGALSAVCFAASMIVMRRIEGVGPFEMQAWIAALSAPVLLLGTLFFETTQGSQLQEAGVVGWGAIVYGVFCASLIGHGGMYYLVQRYEVSLLGPLTLLTPLLGILFGVLIMGDTITWRFIVGGAMTLLGIGIILVREGRAKKHPGLEEAVREGIA
jgi:O-acetylserine/cysteine efflux transporter